MTWPSCEVRYRGTAAAARDSRVLATLGEELVFDGARVIGDSIEVAISFQRED